MIASRILFSFTVFGLFLLASCVEDKDYGKGVKGLRPDANGQANETLEIDENANVAEDSANKLGELINLPFTVEDSVWQEYPPRVEGDAEGESPTKDRKLTAVLRFSKEDSGDLISDLAAKQRPFEVSVDAESWFPAELIALSTTSGDDSLKGLGYVAAPFIKPPYKSGSLIRIRDTDYFVLILQTR